MKLLFLFINSIKLDLTFFLCSPWPNIKKIQLVLSKYQLIFKHQIVSFNLGQSYTRLDGKKYYYNSPVYGIASLQSEWTIHYPMLKGLKKIETVVDIGASVGNFSLLAHTLFPEAKFYAVEPIPQSFEALKLNCASFSNCQKTAISDKSQKMKMSVDIHKPETSTIDHHGTYEIEALTLNQFATDNNIQSVSLLKIDVEKHEKNVLLGADQLLKSTKYLLIEVTSHKNADYSTAELFALLNKQEYNFTTRNAYVYYQDNQVYMIDYLLENIKLP
jgi:FkbM family methyltransferase